MARLPLVTMMAIVGLVSYVTAGHIPSGATTGSPATVVNVAANRDNATAFTNVGSSCTVGLLLTSVAELLSVTPSGKIMAAPSLQYTKRQSTRSTDLDVSSRQVAKKRTVHVLSLATIITTAFVLACLTPLAVLAYLILDSTCCIYRHCSATWLALMAAAPPLSCTITAVAGAAAAAAAADPVPVAARHPPFSADGDEGRCCQCGRVDPISVDAEGRCFACAREAVLCRRRELLGLVAPVP